MVEFGKLCYYTFIGEYNVPQKYYIVASNGIGKSLRSFFKNDNINKFNLLKKNYLSDLERLEFIFDAHDLTQQLVDVECPICHSRMHVEEAESSNDYFIALSSERIKIEIQLSELDDTISDMQNEVEGEERLWNSGGKAWNCEYKYRRGGKTLCALYARENCMGFMVIIGKAEREKFEMRS